MKLTDEEVALVKAFRADKAKKAFRPRTYTDEEKVAAFDTVYRMAMENYQQIVEKGYELKDAEHWCYETVMDLLGEGVWNVINDAR